ncbi:unnamed protein product, partial [Iphiclides podalirius]
MPMGSDSQHKLMDPWQGALPKSRGYKWAISILAWWCSYAVVFAGHLLKSKLFGCRTSILPKICIATEISLLVFQEDLYAHYVHGRLKDDEPERTVKDPSACSISKKSLKTSCTSSTARKRQLELEAAKAKAAVDMELAEAEAEAKINAAKIKANIKSELLNKKLAAEMAELESTSHRSTCRGTICEIEGCNQPHHRLLHWSKPQNEKPETENEEEDEHPNPETVTHMVASHCHKVLLKAVPLTLHGPNGSLHTHAILDDGATVTLISADIADELGLQGENVIMRARSAWDSGELVCESQRPTSPTSWSFGRIITSSTSKPVTEMFHTPVTPRKKKRTRGGVTRSECKRNEQDVFPSCSLKDDEPERTVKDPSACSISKKSLKTSCTSSTARKRQLELEAAKAKAAVDMELAEAEAEAKINAAKIKANIKSELLNKKLAAEMAELESTSHRSSKSASQSTNSKVEDWLDNTVGQQVEHQEDCCRDRSSIEKLANALPCRGTICEIEGCNQPHHRLLHWSKPQNEKPETENEEEDEHPNPETVTHMVASHCHKVLLKAVPLTLHGPNGSLHTHAILDDGATVTLISADIADELGLQGENVIMRARSAWDSGELVCIVERVYPGSDGRVRVVDVRTRNDDASQSRYLSGPLSTCRVACSTQFRSIIKKLMAAGQHTLEKSISKEDLISRFLAAFFERALDGLSWVAKFWWSNEWTLATLDSMIFGIVIYVSNEPVYAALANLIVWQITKSTVALCGNKNIKCKMNIESF